MTNPILFILLAAIAIYAGMRMITSQNAIYSALYLILNMCTLAVFYLALNAPFLAMVQITVYAGAIMVLFLFVIMLLGAEQLGGVARKRDKIPPIILGAVLAFIFTLTVLGNRSLLSAAADPIDASPTAVGITFFQNYVFPFEVTSVLLLVSMIGLVVLQVQRKRK